MPIDRDLKRRIVSHLKSPQRRRGDVASLARCFDVHRRTIEQWLHASARPSPRRVGRPGPTPAQRREVLYAVAGLARMDRPLSCREVRSALKDRFPTRLLDEATRRWKLHRARKAGRRCAARRVRITVHAPDVVWGMDGSHLGRRPDRTPVECQATRDRCSRRTLHLTLGPPADAADVVRILEEIFARIGRRPLVLATDNGSIYTSDVVKSYLAAHEIVHLLNLPRTPQHNAPVERGFGELKELTGLGQGVVIEDVNAAALLLESAVHVLDHARRRPVLGGRTAAERYQDPSWRATISRRKRFYRRARRAQANAAAHAPNARARRTARREAIFATLERFALITRTRGGVPFRAVECERKT